MGLTCTGFCGRTLAESCFERVKNKRKNPVPGLDPHYFSYRAVCKECRKEGRKAAVASRPDVDRNTVPLPEKCARCQRSSPAVFFKWRSDTETPRWRNVCNSCFNEEKYYNVYRDKKREEDEQGFLARNAATAKAWRERNPDNVTHQQNLLRTLPDRKIKHVRTYAKHQGKAFEEADVAAMEAKLSTPCAYCAFAPEKGDPLNGLDCVDSAQGYSDANTVACCNGCNIMKSNRSVDAFVGHVREIARFRDKLGGTSAAASSSKRCRLLFGGTQELRDAKKTKEDKLTGEQKLGIWILPCYLCGRGPAFGIDRVDSFGIYKEGNVQPCCTECNEMKSHHPLEEFLEHVGHIAYHTAFWVLRDYENEPMRRRKPVRALCDPPMVFPSATTAANMIQTSAEKITRNALEMGHKISGVAWERASEAEYRRQRMGAGDALRVIKEMRINKTRGVSR